VALAIIVSVYVVFGGIRGVMYTDALQGSIMFIGMLILFGAIYWITGGVVAGNQALTNLDSRGAGAIHCCCSSYRIHGMDVYAQSLGSPFLVDFSQYPYTGCGYRSSYLNLNLAVRFMTVKSDRELNRAVLIGGIFIFVMTGVSLMLSERFPMFISSILWVN
jgi:SSS family solute:Na+ symporter